jgi:hypothetical protein
MGWLPMDATMSKEEPHDKKNGACTVSWEELQEGEQYHDPTNDAEPPLKILLKGKGMVVFSEPDGSCPMIWKEEGWNPNRYIPLNGISYDGPSLEDMK